MIRIIGHAVSAVLLLCAGIVVAMAAYWLGDRRDPIAFVTVPHVASGSFHPGGEVIVESLVVRKRSCYAKVERAFEDASGTRYVFPDYDMEAVGELSPPPRILRVPVTLPANAASGVGTYRVVVAYGCNPIQRALWPIVVVSPVVPITVTKGKP